MDQVCEDHVFLMLTLLIMMIFFGYKLYDKDGSGCDLCADVEVHVDVGVIADQEAYVEVDAGVIADHEFGGDAILRYVT